MNFLGVDTGATTTRALLITDSGERLGTGRAGGGNPNAHPPGIAAARIAQAVTEALGSHDPAGVGGLVLGLAGVAKLADPAVRTLFDAALRGTGLTCPIRPVADCEAAFATAASTGEGTVLVAGTGSIAARISGHRMVATAGGFGWLLGDEGSAYWLGREAVRATLRRVEREQDLGPLGAGVFAHAGLAPNPDRVLARRELITAVNAESPIRLAGFAPLVTAAVHSDEAAAEIVDRGAALLTETALATRTPGEDSPIVLTGSLVTAGTPVGDRVRAELTRRGGGPVSVAEDGTTGAAWLAALETVPGEAAQALHRKLTS
ncbi:N-acetylglucosamine kinase [Crossiella equi]|nr:BadF/BadG/BcrA/BcrD ATPase family protein [Crossiella equi]